jgi:hypothetical protein
LPPLTLPVRVAVVIVAFVATDNVTTKLSSGSLTLSPITAIAIVCVTTAGGKLSVPDAAV